MKLVNDKKTYFLDSAGLIIIGILSLGYVLFWSTFAESHIQVSFLNFPIFVGEIVLFLCLILFSVKLLMKPVFKRCYWPLIIYFVFVIWKAFDGYLEYGPLALRNAALFYYFSFAVLGYSFYRRNFFDQSKLFMLTVLIIVLFFTRRFETAWSLSLSFLGIIFIRSYPQQIVRFILSIGLVLSFPYITLVRSSRMMMVGSVVAGIYVGFSLYKIWGVRKSVKRITFILVFFVCILGASKFGDTNAMKSIVSFGTMKEIFNFYDQEIERILKDGEYKPRTIQKVGLYNANVNVKNLAVLNEEMSREKKINDQIRLEKERQQQKKRQELTLKKLDEVFKEEADEVSLLQNEIVPIMDEKVLSSVFEEDQIAVDKKIFIAEDVEETFVETERVPVVSVIKSDKESLKEEEQVLQAQNEIKQKIVSMRRMGDAVGNAVFRLFIWRDMFVNFIDQKPILGFSFGKPFRSKSLEVINWGIGDWSRDGWIAAHNSWFHIIYRAGLVGVIFIISVLVVLVRMIKKFIQLKSITGILLCGFIINWFAAANFLLTLELPYTAIPIWTIYGMTFAYYQNLKKSLEKVAYESKK